MPTKKTIEQWQKIALSQGYANLTEFVLDQGVDVSLNGKDNFKRMGKRDYFSIINGNAVLVTDTLWFNAKFALRPEKLLNILKKEI